MRALLFVLMVIACLFVRSVIAHGQVDGGNAGALTIDSPTARSVDAPSPDAAELLKEVQAFRAARTSGDKSATYLAAAGIASLALKFLLDLLKSLKAEDLTDRAKHALPWVVSGLGVVVAVVARYAAGETWTNAVILGGAAPGAVLVHELATGFRGLFLKKPGLPLPDDDRPQPPQAA